MYTSSLLTITLIISLIYLSLLIIVSLLLMRSISLNFIQAKDFYVNNTVSAKVSTEVFLESADGACMLMLSGAVLYGKVTVLCMYVSA